MPTRDSNGRFVNGNPGGPGRKPREVEREYLQVMEEVVDSEAWRAICQRAATDAIGGDAKARSFVASYLLGMPTTRPEEPEQGDKMMEMIDQWRAMKAAAGQQDEAQEE